MNMNKMSPTSRLGLHHVRFPGPFAIILLAVFSILRPAWATPLDEKLSASINKILSRVDDLNQLAHSLSAADQQTTAELSMAVYRPLCEVSYVRELMMITSFVHDEGDKRRIEALISNIIDSLAREVDTSLNYINGLTAFLH